MEAMNKPRDAVSHVPRVILYGVEKVSPHCGGRVTQWGWAIRAGLHSVLQKSRQRQCSVGLRVMGEVETGGPELTVDKTIFEVAIGL